MSPVVVVVVTIIFFAVLGFGAFMVKRELDKTNPENTDTSLGATITTAQDFLPFKTIQDNVIDLGGHDYRMIIECSSINYNLRTAQEKEVIELSFQRMLNAISHPIAFFIQTKTMDHTAMIEEMEKEHEIMLQDIPQMKDYADSYIDEMKELSNHIGNNKQKKKYIIVPFNEAVTLSDLDDAEKYEYSLEEIEDRALRIIDGLSPVGVRARILKTPKLVELVYNTYHKDGYSHYENIVSGEFLEPIVKGENKAQSITDDMRIDWILYEAQMRIRDEITSKEIPEFMLKDYEEVITELNKLRDDTGAHFKG